MKKSLRIMAALALGALSGGQSACAVDVFAGAGSYNPFYGYIDYTDPYGLEDLQNFNYGFQDYGIDYDLDGYYEPPDYLFRRFSSSTPGRWR